MPDETQPAVLPVASLREFFRDALREALSHQHLDVEGETEQYVVNLLTIFARSEALFDSTPEGSRIKPLVVMLAEALEAASPREREAGLQRLGDVSLFVAGFLAHGFARRLVDIDYHIAMGGRAYGALAGSAGRRQRGALRRVFGELSAKFLPMVDALNEVSESGYRHSDRDILRLYEVWLRTGSRRARGLLARLGVTPADGARAAWQH
jgi:hypothetical protein